MRETERQDSNGSKRREDKTSILQQSKRGSGENPHAPGVSGTIPVNSGVHPVSSSNNQNKRVVENFIPPFRTSASFLSRKFHQPSCSMPLNMETLQDLHPGPQLIQILHTALMFPTSP